MLPIYVSYFFAGEPGRRKAFVNSLGFVCGFTMVFVILGAFAGTMGGLLNQYKTPVNIFTGGVVIILGLNFLGVLKIGFLNRSAARTAKVKDMTFISAVVFGAVFSIGWTPCVGAFLGSALMMAAMRGSAAEGVGMLFIYSLGLGAPFVISAVLIERLKTAIEFIKRNYKAINITSGTLLVIVGILMATDVMGRVLALLSV